LDEVVAPKEEEEEEEEGWRSEFCVQLAIVRI
jgi:hypothetical protein